MSNVVRAWKDEAYRRSLSAEEQTMLPANPAGEVELTDTALGGIQGAYGFCGGDSGTYSGGYGSGDSQDGSNNRITQDLDQAAAATFGNKNFVISSAVECTATNSASLSARIKDRNFEL